MPHTLDMQGHRVLPMSVLLVVIAVSIGASLLMIPNEEQLRERLFKDRIGGDIRGLIDLGTFGDKDEARSLFARMSSEQLTFINQIARLTPRERLRRVFNASAPVNYDPFVHYFIVDAVQYIDVIKPDEAFAIISPAANHIPDTFRVKLFRLLARNALAGNSPEVAAKILRQACSSNSADWQTISSLVDAERWTNRPAQARADLQAWIEKHSDSLDTQLFSVANDLMFNLALEANVPGDALETCIRDLKLLAPNAPIPVFQLEQTFKAAKYAGRTREVLPWVERHLASFADDKLSWTELLARTRNRQLPDADYMEWTLRASQVADWNSMADRACYHHLRRVAMGDMRSFERYLSLSDFLGNDVEAAQVLTAMGPVEGREDLQLKLARLSASNGDAKGAVEIYGQWLARHPDDQAARWEQACLKEALAAPAEVMQTFAKLTQDYPDNAKIAKRNVEVLNRFQKHKRSLQELDKLPEEDVDLETLEDYLLLAESMDAPVSLTRALRIKVNKAKTPLVEDYLRLAEIARGADTMDAALVVLNEGVERLPNEPTLRSQMASMLLQEERYDDAVKAAMHPVAWRDRDAKLTALAACIHTDKAREVLGALGDEFSSETQAYSTFLDLAVACRQAGRLNRSQELFAKVPEEPARYYRIAQAYMLASEYDHAVRLAQLNLQSKRMPEAQDWILLGDIRHKQGFADEAQDAYAKAVEAVTARIQRRTASVEPTRTSGF